MEQRVVVTPVEVLVIRRQSIWKLTLKIYHILRMNKNRNQNVVDKGTNQILKRRIRGWHCLIPEAANVASKRHLQSRCSSIEKHWNYLVSCLLCVSVLKKNPHHFALENSSWDIFKYPISVSRSRYFLSRHVMTILCKVN
jgi:hypothetical protein